MRPIWNGDDLLKRAQAGRSSQRRKCARLGRGRAGRRRRRGGRAVRATTARSTVGTTSTLRACVRGKASLDLGAFSWAGVGFASTFTSTDDRCWLGLAWCDLFLSLFSELPGTGNRLCDRVS